MKAYLIQEHCSPFNDAGWDPEDTRTLKIFKNLCAAEVHCARLNELQEKLNENYCWDTWRDFVLARGESKPEIQQEDKLRYEVVEIEINEDEIGMN